MYDTGALQKGEWMDSTFGLRDVFFGAVYAAVERQAPPIGGSQFWVLYRADGQGSVDPYRVTAADSTTMQVVSSHAWNLRPRRTRLGANATAPGGVLCPPAGLVDGATGLFRDRDPFAPANGPSVRCDAASPGNSTAPWTQPGAVAAAAAAAGDTARAWVARVVRAAGP